MDEPRRSVGRPRGTKLSEETKKRIGRGVRESFRAGEAIPPGDMPLDVRRRVFARDQRRCVGCHEPYARSRETWRTKAGWARTEADMRIHRFAAAADSAGIEACATLCGDCRRGIIRGTSTLDDYLSC